MSVFHSRFNVSRRSLNLSHGGMAVQSDARDCDLNHIMARYKSTGVLPLNALRNKQGVYADVSEFGDYKDCLMKVEAAERMFMSMPSDIRDRFQNDPAQFLNFAGNPANAQELIDLGLAVEAQLPPTVRASKSRAERAEAAAKRAQSSQAPVVLPNTKAKGASEES